MIVLVADKQYSIFISDNNLNAYLELVRVKDSDLSRITLEEILSKLKESNICFGINKDLINKSLEQFYSNSIAPPPPPILIAHGQKAEHKQALGVEWLIDPGARHEFERVIAPDHPIAYTISCSEGKPGKDILGQEIKAQDLPDKIIYEADGVYKKTIKDEQAKEQDWYYSHYLGIVILSGEKLSVKPVIQVNMDSPYSAYIELYGYLGDETRTQINASHIIETLERMNITHGWNADLLVKALYKAHRRLYSELESDTIEKFLLLSTNKPIDAQCEKIQWKVSYDAAHEIDKVVGPGQTIASYECTSEGESGMDVYGNEILPKTDMGQHPGAGKNVELSKDKNLYKYRARTLGIVQFEKEISLISLVKVSEDKLSAHIDLPVFSKSTHAKAVTLSQIQKTLDTDGICYGIDNEALQKIVAAIRTGEQGADENSIFFRTIAAFGKKPKEGIDASIELNQQLSAGKIMKNGRIDFKERSYPWNVNKGDEIGRLIPKVVEENGIDIYNQPVMARKAKDLELVLDDLYKNSDGYLFAGKDGTLIVNKNNFSVTEILVLDGNIDNITGNIHTDSTVIVKGHIEPGFCLETAADIRIDANIEKAVAIAKGNIIIRGGVRGQGSRITADGEVNVSFMEHAEIQSNSSIVIGVSAIDCHLNAREDVIAGESESPKSSIVGGITHAYQKVSAGNFGNKVNIKTDIMAGYTLEDQEKYDSLKQEIQNNQKELEYIEEMYVSGAAARENMSQLMEKLEPLGIKVENQKKELAALKELMDSCVNSTIEFYNSTYPGVRITICGHSLIIEHVYKKGVFYLKENRVQYESR